MGTARRHHTGILRRGVWCASRRPPLGVRLFLISLRSPSPILASTFVPPRGRPLLVVLPLVASSSAASLSSASSCDAAAACRSLALAASLAFRRSSALLAAYPGPSSLSSSPRARTTLLTPNGVCGASRHVQKVQKVSRRCPEGVQKMSRRCPEGWKRMWERLEGPLQVCRRPQVFYRRSHS